MDDGQVYLSRSSPNSFHNSAKARQNPSLVGLILISLKTKKQKLRAKNNELSRSSAFNNL